MQPEFWHKRWEQNQIGFHLSEVNPYLQRYWPQLELAPGSRVLVPLCGKSLDLSWLASQGHQVLGIELSEKAIQDFFSEQQVQPQVELRDGFKVYEYGPIQLWCGDFFALQATDVADCQALYDRAALIALPPQMRERYAAHLQSILPQGCQGLLITLDYDQALMAGPPFAVLDDEVKALLGKRWQLRVEEVRDILGESWKFLQGGVTRLEERVYRLLAR
ncbi:thiopurine S-methyltransferase [Pseudomonas chlororaphis]|uniref:thiopurine S-methyltransferase n=1 Tax=Pseudomonas chlororaphis TaxID=587753 RepID=UPI000F48E46C|nr:thiopurine S-methyltransferase [Pseudomonas chlororaphis]ROL84507.1 thiopurine S-methyltransferase [Pseudomonas chlororaphis]WDG52116.1 thiopurine S-methyltransferase [Pseudomonas chlororaphis]WDH51616.1 thiopurine S-methyltransferase [Pseudomonas chlororaphis]WDH86867.1 thiopurine S-methyltransferase [Pseudomonas chlororaphis]